MIYLVNMSDDLIDSPHYKKASIQDVLDYCNNKQVLGIDTETEGMDFVSKKIVMFQIGDENNQFIIDVRCVMK